MQEISSATRGTAVMYLTVTMMAGSGAARQNATYQKKRSRIALAVPDRTIA
jgi:hypothetical protein